MKVMFLTNVPSPYRVDFFNELGKKCELTVLFEKKTSDERDSSWKRYRFNNFRGVFLKGVSIDVDTAICFDVISYLKNESFDVIVICNFLSPTGMFAVKYLKMHHICYCLESDGGIAKSGKGVREWIKRKCITGANLYFSSGKLNDRYLLAYGADLEKIVKYPFSSLWESDILEDLISKCEKQKIRKNLGMREEKIVISVGRFTYLNGYGKGYDVLLKAARALENNIGIYIIGDSPTDEFCQLKEKYGLKNVHFVGFQSKEMLKKYYKAADLFVLMTVSDVWGLVINEAMSNGLPIITTNMCGAGIELVDDTNGAILPVGDNCGLATKIIEILADETARKDMAFSSLKKIKEYTIEQMVEMHMKHFEALTLRKGI